MSEDEQGGGWRREPVLPAAQLLASPYEPFRTHGPRNERLSGRGTKCISRTPCDEDAPQLIPPVETTPAPLSEEGVLSAIQAGLAEKDLLPNHQLVDSGYVTIAHLVQSQGISGVDLVGPTLKTQGYQAETGYARTHFSSDWEAETVTCPQGRISSSWTAVQDAGKALITVKFSASATVRSVPVGLPVRERRGAA